MINGMALAQDPPAHVKVHGNVYGGGNKAVVMGSSSVLMNKSNSDTILGDVYGGGALAHVNATMTVSGSDTTYTYNEGTATHVTILQGVINGNVYGGGLGDSISYGGSADIAALVYGKVFVNIGNNSGGPTLKSSVFGCNNINGTPLDSVFVNIYKTAHTTGEHNNQYPAGIDTYDELESSFPADLNDPNYAKEFAIKAVYGGGNKASYKPNLNGNGDPKCTTVHVFECDENTIQTIYGGGNAADVGTSVKPADTRLIIEGGRYDQVFGGGNGYSVTHNHDHPDQLYYNPGANIFGTALTDVQGGLYRQVFGGSNQYGNIATVSLGIDNQCDVLLIYESFGGANEANISGNINTTLYCNNKDYEIGNFYGGSNLADIDGSVTLNILGGQYHNIFGGSKGTLPAPGATQEQIAAASADISGAVTLNLHGGTMENAFGGSDVFGSILGAINVNVWDTVANCQLQVDTVYGGGRDAAYTPSLVNGEKIVSPIVNLWNGTVGHGSVNGCVFGGGKGSGAVVTAHPKVMIGDTLSGLEHENNRITIYYNDSHYGNIFGGGNAAQVDGIDSVLMLKGNSHVGNLFGGGNAAEADSAVVIMNVVTTVDTIFGGGNLAGLTGSALVTVTNGTVRGGIYGGSNKSGTVDGDITVNVTGSSDNHTTIGANDAHANLHGGGYGQDTQTKGHVTVNYGDTPATFSEYPKVYGDIYGGSALGWVNDATDGGIDTTTVNILNGNVYGNVYGGGLGRKQGDIKAGVNGKVFVNIGTIDNNSPVGNVVFSDTSAVFGCNNLHGSPQDSVFVNIYQTAHGDDIAHNLYPTLTSGTWTPELLATNAATQTYAIQSVFGGGNQASYTPVANRSTQVYVYGCENTIKDVFGGGNAANVGTTGEGAVSANTFILIDGGRINRVFGGGNGSPVAANIYGTATTTINAGLIDTIFGGSNMLGSITATSLNLDKAGDCDDEVFRVIYGGANLAPISSNLNTTINCGVGAIGEIYGGSNKATITGNVELNINGGTINYAYGGSKGDNTNSTDAWIDGNVQLNLYGGTVHHAFGGSNLLGNVKRQITVNALDTVSAPCNLVLDTVYGGGNLAPYAPDNSNLSSPLVNIINGTVNKFVYGGGLGASATVTANPVVKVGYDAVSMATLLTPGVAGSIVATGFTIPDTIAIVTGEVYGGGDAALVTGSTSVTLDKVGSSAIKLFGGGNQAGVSGAASVTMNHGFVSDGVYGGCNTSGSVDDDINVYVNGGKVGTNRNNCAYGVFGGGYGNSTNTGANVTVTIGNTDSIPVIYGDVYGGSAQGNVNNSTSDLTKVWIKKGIIVGDVYGGGFGDEGKTALVKGNVQVVVDGGTVDTVTSASVGGRVFGCNNKLGTPEGTVEVTVNATNPTVINGSGVKVYALKGVYGGGNLAHYEPTTTNNGYPKVNIYGCTTSVEDVFGGGNAAAVPQTDVTVYAGDIKRVFAGGNGTSGAAHVGYKTSNNTPSDGDGYGSGTACDTVYGGTVTQVFGGSNTNGRIRESSAVCVDKTGSCPMIIGEVYGGGNLADGNAGEIKIGCTGTWTTTGTNNHTNHNSSDNRIGYELEGIGTVYGGANQANVANNIELNINSGIVENVFAGNNLDGTISGTIQVEIDSIGTCDWYVGNVYGGGNQAAYGTAGSNYPVVNIKRGLVSGDVFGGGLGSTGTVTGNPQVTVNSDKARVNGSVYGGGSLASTVGNPLVTLTEGSLTQVFGGGKAASVTGAPIVNINGGTVSTGVYGGCHNQGEVSNNITVNVTGGTINSDVFGGGYGQETSTSGNVVVNIGEQNPVTHNDFPKIYGDVYGGSAFGEVNADNNNTTTVNINNGTLYTTAGSGGNVYGGGLGYYVDTNHDSIPAKVNGVVTVNIGSGEMDSSDPRFTSTTSGEAIIQGNVYGCNNTYGSPQHHVTVNIFKTYIHPDTIYSATYIKNDGIHGEPAYELANVFGGGNRANFLVNDSITVNVYSCDNTIRRTFGGSNAAASKSVFTMIQGGRIHEAFGGGNGEVSPAHVNGNVTLEIHGGRVDQSFGGSNQQGTITGTSTVTIDSEGGCGESIIEEFFCGGNFANYYGDIDATIDCADGLHIQNLYGGCKQADVLPSGEKIGNVHLVVNGGTYENIFGGSQGRLAGVDPEHPEEESADISGNILLEINGGKVTNAIFGGSHILGNVAGTITVNIEDKNTGCPLDLSAADVYGGGNQADYVTPTVAGDESAHDYPQVNVKNATVKNVFGGGLEAKVTGNPQIRIKKGSKVLGNVYGGGNMGELIGNPKVIVNGKDATENPHVFPNIELPDPTKKK